MQQKGKYLDSINKELETTVVMCTHDKEIVNKFKKRVILLDKGMLIKDTQKGTYKNESIKNSNK